MTVMKILVPLDGSRLAERALPWAERIGGGRACLRQGDTMPTDGTVYGLTTVTDLPYEVAVHVRVPR